MKSFMSICLNKNGDTPIYRQLGDALISLITEGILEPDSRLPPIRKMADSLKINSSTVVNAYKYLEAKQAVYSICGSGTYVAPIKTDCVSVVNKKLSAPFVAETKVKCDFTRFMPSKCCFPSNDIKRAFNTIIDREMGDFFLRGSLKSAEALNREALRLIKKHGIFADKDCCFIPDSMNQAFELAAGSIIKKGDYVVLEKPAGYSRAGAYAEMGAKILQAPIGADGIDLNVFESLLKLYRPKAAHISPYFQTPTNVCLSVEKKRALLELCYKFGVIIVEEDLYSDLMKDGKKVFLNSLDYRGQVIYVKSITKTFMPWFSAGLCVFPKKYAPNAESVPLHCSNSVQMKILCELFVSGIFENLSKNIVKNHEGHYEKFADIIDDQIGGFIEYNKYDTGTGFWLKLKKGDSTILAHKCAEKGVLIIPSDIYLGGGKEHFRMCLTSLDSNALDYGFRILRKELTSISGK